MKRAVLVVSLCLVVASVASPPPPADPNAPLLTGAQVDARVLGILRRSCADCHSEATRYPWYSYVAPVSWLIRRDVVGGRKHLDFSHWNDYSTVRKERLLSEIANQVKDRDMPLVEYTWIHRGTRLSEDEMKAVFAWTQKERMRLITASAP